MDKMQDWEIFEFFNNLQYSNSVDWEMTRWIMYSIVQSNSSKQLKVTDILKLPWDNDKSNNNIEISNNEIIKLNALANKFKDKI